MKSKTKKAGHTPGPWEIDFSDMEITRGQKVVGYLDKVNEANARLIAAAPDLLEALKLFVGSEHSDSCIASLDAEGELAGCDCGLVEGRAAIAKAEGTGKAIAKGGGK